MTKIRRLGDILLEQEVITETQLQAVLQDQRQTRLPLGVFMLKRGIVSRDQLGAALAEQYETPFYNCESEAIHSQLVRLLPEPYVRRRRVAPVGLSGKILRLGMQNPSDMEAISEIELMTGYQVEAAICLEDDIDRLLESAFDDRIKAKQAAVDMRLAELKERGHRETHTEDISEDSDAPVVRLLDAILMGAVRAEASDIHLEPDLPQMRVRYRIDGQLHQIMSVPDDSEDALVGRVKVLADLDTAEKRRPQDGNLSIEVGETRASFRVSCIPCVRGEKVVMRVLDESSKTFDINSLGMPDPQLQLVKKLLDRPHGMIVMTGPTGSGKTTTMYSMLCDMDSAVKNISTIEDPVEFRLPGINQVHANNEFGMGFANGLKYLMRQDPDVILVGEIRDHETATTAVQAALTGHLLISTLHTNDAVGTVARLSDLGLDHFKIAGSLVASIAQRLLRRLCEHCKRPCEANQNLLQTIYQGRQVPDEFVDFGGYFEAVGCEHCGGTGYTGRIPIFEIMVITPKLEQAIESGLPASQLRTIACEGGMIDLATMGLRQAVFGVTSIDEVYFKLSG
ncbi:Flp pilus assembly complex ATPase component TadA [Stieleria sp. JC731]|uniref:GspE/PulE family protein n=1 Tax=Pirellulaceae TaxID=2691357 RepID=UPI001E46CA89|nr:ATPase, T2SS/T4P/T4SS family [Stieleria sp. JC731]MCC9601558.1 Flp pilus assembly complex ATPase component TadA [Stieleria sp. JC731]